jgi:hypothetical protein
MLGLWGLLGILLLAVDAARARVVRTKTAELKLSSCMVRTGRRLALEDAELGFIGEKSTAEFETTPTGRHGVWHSRPFSICQHQLQQPTTNGFWGLTKVAPSRLLAAKYNCLHLPCAETKISYLLSSSSPIPLIHYTITVPKATRHQDSQYAYHLYRRRHYSPRLLCQWKPKPRPCCLSPSSPGI